MGNRQHMVTAYKEGREVGKLEWTAKEVKNVETYPEHRRQGVATALWNEGHRLAETNARIPAPKHSSQRTNAGNEWARSVGGRLPRRVT
jgi:GNAT superfamily N-acetyltransferase